MIHCCAVSMCTLKGSLPSTIIQVLCHLCGNGWWDEIRQQQRPKLQEKLFRSDARFCKLTPRFESRLSAPKPRLVSNLSFRFDLPSCQPVITEQTTELKTARGHLTPSPQHACNGLAQHSKARSAPHCRVVPLGELNSMIQISLPMHPVSYNNRFPAVTNRKIATNKFDRKRHLVGEIKFCMNGGLDQ